MPPFEVFLRMEMESLKPSPFLIDLKNYMKMNTSSSLLLDFFNQFNIRENLGIKALEYLAAYLDPGASWSRRSLELVMM